MDALLLRRVTSRCEGAWIAAYDGRRMGCAFALRKRARTAPLRLLRLTSDAQDMGLDARITDTYIAFAQAPGYGRMVLQTHECLPPPARRTCGVALCWIGRSPMKLGAGHAWERMDHQSFRHISHH
ncbi:MAG: hypothetical protein ACK40S_04340 [Burkholderiaceae bacterium]